MPIMNNWGNSIIGIVTRNTHIFIIIIIVSYYYKLSTPNSKQNFFLIL